MTRTSAYERLIDALKDHGSKVIATGRRAQAQAQCPVPGHGSGRGDQNPSLSITGMEGEALIYCHAGCDPSDIMGALGMTLPGVDAMILVSVIALAGLVLAPLLGLAAD